MRAINNFASSTVEDQSDYPVETRDEAPAGTLRIRCEGDSFRSSPGDLIRDRGVNSAYDSRDYFLDLGRRLLPGVEQQIKTRNLTPKFAKGWGVIMMGHGFTSAHILDDSDELSHRRAGVLPPKRHGSVTARMASRSPGKVHR